MHAYGHTYVRTYISTYVHTYIHTRTYIHTCPLDIHSRVRVYVCIHIPQIVIAPSLRNWVAGSVAGKSPAAGSAGRRLVASTPTSANVKL